MYQIWDKTQGFNLADGTSCTVNEIYAKYPFTKNGTIIIEKLPNGNVGAIDSLDIIKQVFNVSVEDDIKALEAIEVARNAPAIEQATVETVTLDLLAEQEERLCMLELNA